MWKRYIRNCGVAACLAAVTLVVIVSARSVSKGTGSNQLPSASFEHRLGNEDSCRICNTWIDAISCTAANKNQSVSEVDVKSVLPASCKLLEVTLLTDCYDLVAEYTFDVSRMVFNETPLDRICLTLELCAIRKQNTISRLDCSNLP